MSIVDLDKARRAKNPKIAGVAVCAACKHEWAAETDVGEVFLTCPSCHTAKGRFVHPTLLQDAVPRLQCLCGCQMFQITAQKTMHCVNCAAEVVFPT